MLHLDNVSTSLFFFFCLLAFTCRQSENETRNSNTQIFVDPWHEAAAQEKIEFQTEVNCFFFFLEGKSFFSTQYKMHFDHFFVKVDQETKSFIFEMLSLVFAWSKKLFFVLKTDVKLARLTTPFTHFEVVLSINAA